jgi:hypothetical protein
LASARGVSAAGNTKSAAEFASPAKLRGVGWAPEGCMHSQAIHKIKKALNVLPVFKSRSFSFAKYAREGADKKKPAQ